MLEALVLAVLMSSEPPAPGRAELRRELDGVAVRIAELKAKAMTGEDVRAELEPLLVRAQELAGALERTTPASAVPPASPGGEDGSAHLRGEGGARAMEDELRARADALFEEADAVAGELAELEARITAALDAGARRRDAAARAPAAGHVSPAAIRVEEPAPGRCLDTDGPAPPPPPAIAPLLAERARLKARIRTLLGEAAELDHEADRLER